MQPLSNFVKIISIDYLKQFAKEYTSNELLQKQTKEIKPVAEIYDQFSFSNVLWSLDMSGIIRLGDGRGHAQCPLQRPPGRRGPAHRQEDLPDHDAAPHVHVHAQLRHRGEGRRFDGAIRHF